MEDLGKTQNLNIKTYRSLHKDSVKFVAAAETDVGWQNSMHTTEAIWVAYCGSYIFYML